MLEIKEIAMERDGGDALVGLTRVPPYVGDDAFRAFLGRYACPTSLEVIRMQLLGAAVSPGREADIYPLVEDFFEAEVPELEGEELVLFLQTFLGLFNEVRAASRHAPVALSPLGTITSREGVKDVLYRRIDEVVFGFLDGVWDGDDELRGAASQRDQADPAHGDSCSMSSRRKWVAHEMHGS